LNARAWAGGGTVDSEPVNNTTSPVTITKSVIPGATTFFTITPSAGSTPTVTGCEGLLSGTSPNYTYTTEAINADCTVTATFSLNSYTVTGSAPGAGSGGSIAPPTRTVSYNTPATFTITPDWGYSIDSVNGCSGTLSGNIYTTGAVTTNCTVTAAFIINSYTVTGLATANGSIAPAGDQTVNHDGTIAFTITPDSGYEINNVLGCNGVLSGTSPNYTYTTGAITGPCKVIVFFRSH
ncbi:MAG: hypothetical protein HQK62_13755, partial [Desulfamplus sp.]|nr:hypothetical protein [Desulfamplus sp.]